MTTSPDERRLNRRWPSPCAGGSPCASAHRWHPADGAGDRAGQPSNHDTCAVRRRRPARPLPLQAPCLDRRYIGRAAGWSSVCRGGADLVEAYPVLRSVADRVQLGGEDVGTAVREVLHVYHQMLSSLGDSRSSKRSVWSGSCRARSPFIGTIGEPRGATRHGVVRSLRSTTSVSTTSTSR